MMKISEALIEVKNLRGYYKGAFGVVHGVDDISFSVEKGERLGIAGESGCGKTTLIELLTGTPEPLLHYEGGEVIIEGYNVWQVDSEILRKKVKCNHLSYVPQSSLNAINPTKKIKEFLADMLNERRDDQHYTPQVAGEMVGEHFERLGLDKELTDRYPFELSGGQRQRANIAISTFAEPSVLLIDEPTSSLDVTSQKKMIELLISIQRKGIIDSLICVSHDFGVLRQLCDRLIVMYAGRIAESGDIDDLIENPHHPYVVSLLSSLIPLEKEAKNKLLSEIPGLPPDLRNPPSGCRYHPRCEECMDICKEQDPPSTNVNGGNVKCWLYEKG